MQSHDHVCQIDFLKKQPRNKNIYVPIPLYSRVISFSFYSTTYLSKITVDGSAGLELARVPRVPRVPSTREIFGQ